MSTIDFEAEARARRELVDLLRVVSGGWYRDGEMSKMLRDAADRIENDARARAEGQADGYRLGVEAAIAPLRGMKTNERAGYMAAIPQTKEMCAYTALILLECMGRIRALLPPEPAKAEPRYPKHYAELCTDCEKGYEPAKCHGARR